MNLRDQVSLFPDTAKRTTKKFLPRTSRAGVLYHRTRDIEEEENMSIRTLADIVRFHAAERPLQTAMIYTADNRRWTFQDLDQESNRVAQALHAAGIDAGDRIAYLDKNSPEYFTYLYGGAKLNAVSVAVNWRLAPPFTDRGFSYRRFLSLMRTDEMGFLVSESARQSNVAIFVGDIQRGKDRLPRAVLFYLGVRYRKPINLLLHTDSPR